MNRDQIYNEKEQIGLSTFRTWPIESDLEDDEDRYNFLSSGTKESDIAPGDQRIIMSSGPFNMLPGMKARFALSWVFADTYSGQDPDGSFKDITGLNEGENIKYSKDGSLINLVLKIRELYYKNKLVVSAEDPIESIHNETVNPNPSPGTFNYYFSIDSPGYVKLSIYDAVGNEIEVLSNKYESSGDKVYRFNTPNISDGVYFIKLQTNNIIRTRKLVIIR